MAKIIVLYYVVIILWILTKTYIHELGHVLTAWKYKKTKAVIVVKGNPKTFWHTKNLTIYKGRIDSYGQVYLENDYQDYTPAQIKKIAAAGYLYPFLYMLLLNLLYIVLMAQIVPVLFLMYLLPLNVLLLLYALVMSVLPAKKNMVWTDKNIFKDPEGFLRYMKSEESEKDQYQFMQNKRG